jgi:uncharacterized phage protein (TIGR02218 family)
MPRDFKIDWTKRKLHLARLARFVRLDGVILRVADAEAAIGPIAGETFTPLPGCLVSNVRHYLNGDVPSAQIDFAHSAGGVLDTFEINVGAWDGAAVDLYVVDRDALPATLGDTLFTGTVQPITLDPVGGSGSFDLRGLAALADGGIETYSPMCRKPLYGTLCGLTAATYAKTATIATIEDRFNFIASGMSSPPVDGWFNQGSGVTGDGVTFDIANYDQGAQRFTLPLTFGDERLFAGDTITVYPGCDKTIETCRDKFANTINFGGEIDFLGAKAIRGTV